MSRVAATRRSPAGGAASRLIWEVFGTEFPRLTPWAEL